MSRDDSASRNLGHTEGQVWGSTPPELLCSNCVQMYCDRKLLLPDIDCICEGGNGEIKYIVNRGFLFSVFVSLLLVILLDTCTSKL